MVSLVLKRLRLLPESTVGALLIHGQAVYFTLEDAVREVAGQPVESWKVPGKTAIPAGSYSLTIDFSNRFQKDMPHVLDVPGFSGVRIHGGLTHANTEGCPLIAYGANLLSGTLTSGTTLPASSEFTGRLQDWLKADVVQLRIENPDG